MKPEKLYRFGGEVPLAANYMPPGRKGLSIAQLIFRKVFITYNVCLCIRYSPHDLNIYDLNTVVD